jgi:6-phosphofructokinase 1
VSTALTARGIEIGIAAKDLGYELRCAPPGGFDIQYARSLGYSAARFLLDGGTEAMVTIQGGRLVPVPFRDLLDPKTGRVRLRYADVSSEAYRTLYAYMIRLKREDFERPEQLKGPGGRRAGSARRTSSPASGIWAAPRPRAPRPPEASARS